ncbi:XRE family transcriptional regulator [Caballeronia grimmiae]|uniref:XRE family transcriptional regulator n=1 Tax=Caballeronia grimmiae TaxID=1071679 RepID=UPI0038BB81E7
MLQLDRSRDATLLPVVDTLYPSSGGVTEGLGKLSGAAESFDQLPVSNGGERFLVHASLNTTFRLKSNSLLNNTLFKCAKIAAMHATMKRLYEAAERLHKRRGQTDVANLLNESPQVLNNWERRGVSKVGIFKAAAVLGVSPTWLLHGVGDMTAADTVDGQSANKDKARPVFGNLKETLKSDNHVAQPDPIRYSLDLTQLRRVYVLGKAQGGLPERIWTDGDYPVGATDEYAELSSPDPHAFICPVVGDSMFPRFMPGEYVLVQPSRAPEIEDTVLVRLSSGETMLKRLLSRRDGHVRLGSWNDPTILTYPERDITWLYSVAHTVPAWMIKHVT